MKTLAVVFDLDGTLVNSLSDIAEVVNMTRRFYGYTDLPNEKVRQSIGKGIEFLVQGCFPEATQDQIPEILKKHREFYLKYPHDTGTLYPGVRKTLDYLRGSKTIRLGVATNKPKQVAVLTLEHYLPGFHFDAVCGPEDVTKKKPAPEHLLETLKKMDCSSENALFCGDDPVDEASALAAGVRFYAAGWGFGGVKGNDSNHLNSFSELLSVIFPS